MNLCWILGAYDQKLWATRSEDKGFKKGRLLVQSIFVSLKTQILSVSKKGVAHYSVITKYEKNHSNFFN